MSYPYVAVQRGAPTVASAGWALDRLQAQSPGDEREAFSQAGQTLLKKMHHNSARLLQLFALADYQGVLEMNLTSQPSFDERVPPRMLIAVRLHVAAASESEALEACLAQGLVLEPLLNRIWEGAEFRPITGRQEYQRCFRPFTPGSCLRVQRRIDRLCLAHPFAGAAKGVLGFGPSSHERPARRDEQFLVEHCFPWAPSADDWGLLLETLLSYPAPLWIQARFGNRAGPADAIRRCEEAIKTCEQFLAGGAEVTLRAQTELLRNAVLDRVARLQQSALRGAVLLFAPGPADFTIAGLVGQSISGDRTRGAEADPYQGGFDLSPAPAAAAWEPFEHFESEPFTATEAACAFRLPAIFSVNDRGLPVRRNRLLPAEARAGGGGVQEVTRLAVNQFQRSERVVEISVTHRLKHVFLIGMTGAGKSNLMLHMLLQDLQQGRGVFLIDPHGDLADDLLARFPHERDQDLILIDLADRQRPVPLNVLAWKGLEERDLIIDELLASLIRTYRDHQMFGPIFEMNFRAMLKLLMGDQPDQKPQFTLLEFPHLYLKAELRNYLLERTGEQEVKDFVEELENVSRGCENSLTNLAPYVTNKFARLLQDPHMRRILGHGAMALDFAEILRTGKVVIVKLARGQFGTGVADMLTSHLAARMRLAAMARAALPPERRTPYFLYVDEFGSLARDDTFSQMLSEARKCGLGLVLATQYARQLRDADGRFDNLSAVLGNVGTLIAFRVGVEDADLLAPAFAPGVTPRDLISLPNFEGYIRLHADASIAPFSFRTFPPPGGADAQRRAGLERASRQRWGVSVEECDRRIRERRQLLEAPIRLKFLAKREARGAE